jgi:2-dehydropantoate 2-reductase
MRILIFGAGVIGSVIGWQLQRQGNEISHFVRREKRASYEKTGIRIRCADQRSAVDAEIETEYRPLFVDSLAGIGSYDLRIVSVKSNQLLGVLREFEGDFRKAPAMIMQNVGLNDFEEIKQLHGEDTSFVYPFITGGGRKGELIECSIFASPLNNMVIGNPLNKYKEIERALFAELKKCGLRPIMSRRIIPYLKLHYAWAVCAVSAYMHAGSYEKFLEPENMEDSYRAMRECFARLREEGVDSRRMLPYAAYHLPLFALVPYSRSLYGTAAMRTMVEGHVRSSPDEMAEMYSTLYERFREDLERMPIFASYKEDVISVTNL